SIGNMQNPTWEQAERLLSEATAGSRVPVEVENNDGHRKAELKIPARDSEQLGEILGYAPVAPVIDDATAGYPADRAGIKRGDRIVGVNGHPIQLWGQFQDAVRSSNGTPVALDVQRNGDTLHLTVTPQKEPTRDGDPVWVIGLSPVEN